MRSVESAVGYAETSERIAASIDSRGLTLFARVDHSGGASDVGLELADEQVFIFGNARGGTPLMQADARMGLELPLRMLVWSDGDRVLVGYRDPHDWAAEYSVDSQVGVLDAMAGLLESIAAEATAAPA
jgi:uncharacterized protein (DUF302 family)